MAKTRKNPYANYPYRLFIGGNLQAAFHEAQMQAGTVHFLRGISTSRNFDLWLETRQQEKPMPLTFEMTVYAENGEEVASWQFDECVPTCVESVSTQTENEISIETLSCTHEGFSQLN